METLRTHVEDEQRSVPYRYLSRSCRIEENEAKRLLHEYGEQTKGETCDIVYAVSGWNSDEQGVGTRHTITLCKREQLSGTEQSFQAILGVHAYGVQPKLSNDPCDLWAMEYMQDQEELANNVAGAVAWGGAADPLAAYFDEEEKQDWKDGVKKGPPATRTSPRGKGGLGAIWDKKLEETKPTKSAGKASPTKPADDAEKHGKVLGVSGVKKPAAKSQKGIMAFFGKK